MGSAKTTEDRTSQVESSTKIKLSDKNIKTLCCTYCEMCRQV